MGSAKPSQFHTIYSEPQSFIIKKAFYFLVSQENIIYKLANISFSKKENDIYLAFPYRGYVSFKCSLQTQNGDISQTFTMDKNVSDSEIPVKLSYHKSGVVQFKPQGKTSIPARALARTKGIPLEQFSGQHMFTLEIEGINDFEQIRKEQIKLSESYIFPMQTGLPRFRIVGYAGSDAAQVTGKYFHGGIPLPPHLTVRLERTNLKPLVLGIYFFNASTLNVDGKRESYILALSGFYNDSFLVMQANDTKPSSEIPSICDTFEETK
jgi:hypothetical protein